MTQLKDIVKLDFQIRDENAEEDLWRALTIIRPHWTRDATRIVPMTDGKFNRMFCCHLLTDAERLNAIVVRIHPANIKVIIGSDNDAPGFILSAHQGCSPPVYAVFDNGIIYGYAPGQTLLYRDFDDPKYIRLIAPKIAAFNCIDPTALDMSRLLGEPFDPLKESVMIQKVDTFLANWPEQLDTPERTAVFNSLPGKGHLLEELAKLKILLTDLNLPLVWSHNDVHPKNVIYNEEDDAVVLIDLDFVGYNYEMMDIAYFLIGNSIFMRFGLCGPGDGDLSEESIRLWLRVYLETKSTLQGQTPSDVTEETVEYYYKLVEKLTAITLFCLTICYVSVAAKQKGFSGKMTGLHDLIHDAVVAYQKYLSKKHVLFDIN